MASGVAAIRRQYRNVVCGTLGRGPSNPREHVSEQEWDRQSHVLLALPTVTQYASRLQDPTTGGFLFQFDASQFDGPDVWG
jgi:hypothetical protein